MVSVKLIALIQTLLLLSTSINATLPMEAQNAQLTESDIRNGLICQKEIDFTREYLSTQPESLSDVQSFFENLQICQNEQRLSGNGTCPFSFEKVVNLANKIKTSKILMDFFENIRINCSRVSSKALATVSLLIEEQKFTQDQLDLKDTPQASKLAESYNLKLSLPTLRDIANSTAFAACLAIYFYPAFLLAYNQILDPTNIVDLMKLAVAPIPVSPFLVPHFCFHTLQMMKEAAEFSQD